MTLVNRIAKKLRRRTRIKGTRIRPTAGLTVAELLITSWYGEKFSSKFGPTTAEERARKRIDSHMQQWANTPKSTKVSRQVRRRQAMARI